jgi:uncharacterized protein (DUF433 family)
MAATLSIETIPQPLRVDAHGAARVGKTRVTLETVIVSYQMGKGPEEIVESFDTLDLGDVYLVIGYYLHHREQIDAYLTECEREAEALRREIEARSPQDGLKERLLARLQSQQR